MGKFFSLAAAILAALTQAISAALPPEYEALKADAEKLFADGSFARANELYRSANTTNLPAAEQRWISFRLADTQWRSAAATESADTTQLDEARRQLDLLIRDVTRAEDRDRVWVEVQESLGDFFWTRRNQQSWGEAWPHYEPVLDWWAGTREIELARERYLKLVWRMAKPPGVSRDFQYGYWGNSIPLQVLNNAIKIAKAIITVTSRFAGDWNGQVHSVRFKSPDHSFHSRRQSASPPPAKVSSICSRTPASSDRDGWMRRWTGSMSGTGKA